MIYRRNIFRSLLALGVWPFTKAALSAAAAPVGAPISHRENPSMSEPNNMKSSSVLTSQQANEAAVRRYADAWQKNDLATIVDCYHDEVVFHYFGRSPLAG